MLFCSKKPLTLIIGLTFTLFLLFASFHISSAEKNQINQSEHYKNQVEIQEISNALSGLYKLVKFFEMDSHAINLDGLFGIRIAEGEFLKLNQINEFPGFDDVLNYKLKLAIDILTERLTLLSNIVTRNVKKQIPKYYENFKLIVNTPFIFNNDNNAFKSHTLKLKKYYNDTNLITQFKERFSDSCLSLLMKNNEEKKCVTDDSCFEYFLQENASEYFLTHQLLYFMIAEHIGCLNKVISQLELFFQKNERTKKLARNILYNKSKSIQTRFDNINTENKFGFIKNQLYNYYCSKVYHEASQSSNIFTLPQIDLNEFEADLFIEQNVLCGLLGIREFHDEKFLQVVKAFQLPSGCYGGDISEDDFIMNDLPIEDTLDEIIESFEPINQIQMPRVNSKGRRFKRFDMRMSDGCSSHESGLAIAFYAIYIEQGLKTLKH